MKQSSIYEQASKATTTTMSDDAQDDWRWWVVKGLGSEYGVAFEGHVTLLK